MVEPERSPGTESDEAGGDSRANIARRIVQLHKEFYGRGPDKAKTYVNGDLVVVLLRGGFSRVEETLLQAGRGESVIRQRGEFHDLMRDRFVQVIEDEIGRKVVAMMSNTHQHPDLQSELFVLEPADILVDP